MEIKEQKSEVINNDIDKIFKTEQRKQRKEKRLFFQIMTKDSGVGNSPKSSFLIGFF